MGRCKDSTVGTIVQNTVDRTNRRKAKPLNTPNAPNNDYSLEKKLKKGSVWNPR